MKMTAESVKEEMRRRVLRGSIFVAVLAALLVVVLFVPLKPAVGDEHYADFMAGMQAGLLTGITLVAVFYLAKNIAAMRDEAAARALLIKENDERAVYIAQKIGMSSYKYVAFGLVAAAVAASYFSVAAFAALLGAALYEIAVRLVLYAYYRRKI